MIGKHASCHWRPSTLRSLWTKLEIPSFDWLFCQLIVLEFSTLLLTTTCHFLGAVIVINTWNKFVNYPVAENSSNINFVGCTFLDFFLHFLLVSKGLIPHINVIFQGEGELSIWEIPLCHWNNITSIETKAILGQEKKILFCFWSARVIQLWEAIIAYITTVLSKEIDLL